MFCESSFIKTCSMISKKTLTMFYVVIQLKPPLVQEEILIYRFKQPFSWTIRGISI